MKKALVTGAGGFVGMALIKKLLEEEIEVIALARKEPKGGFPNGVRYIPFQLEESSRLHERIQERDIDVFYHLAWTGVSDSSRKDPRLQLNNVLWMLECMESSKKMNCKKFVCAGSILEQETIVVANQEEGLHPMMMYGGGKIAAHIMGMAAADSLGIDLCWAILTNTYGPGENSPRIINSTIRKILTGEPLKFTTAAQNYDFVYITDTAEAFYRIGEFGKHHHTYLIGSSHAKPLKEFILEIQRVLAPDREFQFGVIPFASVSLPLECFDCTITEQDTGFHAKVSFTEGIQKTMKWLKETSAASDYKIMRRIP